MTKNKIIEDLNNLTLNNGDEVITIGETHSIIAVKIINKELYELYC